MKENKCPKCKGAGGSMQTYSYEKKCGEDGPYIGTEWVSCSKCKGSGKIESKETSDAKNT